MATKEAQIKIPWDKVGKLHDLLEFLVSGNNSTTAALTSPEIEVAKLGLQALRMAKNALYEEEDERPLVERLKEQAEQPDIISPEILKLAERMKLPETVNTVPLDMVDHPPHYTSHPSGIECIEITEHFGFNLGNAMKYIWRADLKKDAIEDLEKAVWYVQRELSKRREGRERKGKPGSDQ